MAEWSSQGIVISLNKFGEDQAILQLFSQDRGIISGMIKRYNNQKVTQIYNQGNIVNFTWKARLEQHLGYLSCELVENTSLRFFDNYKKLLALNSICQIIKYSLPEQEPNCLLYNKLLDFFAKLKTSNDWLKDYILFEITLLKELGFGLDLTKCAVTETRKNLTHVSPKSGKAVSKSIAEDYLDKLLILPAFVNDNTKTPNNTDLFQGLKLSLHFLNKNILSVRKIKIPSSRIELMKF